MKEQEKIHNTKSEKKNGIAVLVSEKVDFSTRHIYGDK